MANFTLDNFVFNEKSGHLSCADIEVKNIQIRLYLLRVMERALNRNNAFDKAIRTGFNKNKAYLLENCINEST